MEHQLRPTTQRDGTIDAEYTWGRPVSTYLSTLEHLRLLLVKARLDEDAPDHILPAPRTFKPC